jgi:hypothetical protein
MPKKIPPTAEHVRLLKETAREEDWKRWGPYLAEREWGTVREDYSADGDYWNYFTHDQARSRAYRWGEDGLLGICDRGCRVCFSIALWNEKDPILKERFYGLNGHEGNHGCDVKEEYFYLDATPTHSYAKALYKYPQAEFPYRRLIDENKKRGIGVREFELTDTGIFAEGRYFDVTVEYAKGAPEDLLIRVTIANRGPVRAPVHLLPTLWFRNTWAWGSANEDGRRPSIRAGRGGQFHAAHAALGAFDFHYDRATPPREILFTENETNRHRLFGARNAFAHVKDAFHARVVDGDRAAVNPARRGTKAAAHYAIELEPGESRVFRFRLQPHRKAQAARLGPEFDWIFARRQAEADRFYDRVLDPKLAPEERHVARLAQAGLFWSRQFYHYIPEDWRKGDPKLPPPPPQRLKEGARNLGWKHFYAEDILSMPDKWEFPWFASWDLAFQAVCLADADPAFAKEQVELLLREWYLHPNGQLPAYENALNHVNPPIHAWAAWRIYKMTGAPGKRDRAFLESVFQKLLVNFTWWMNRVDLSGNDIFGGGFLGLDNIGLFDRSEPLPHGRQLQQADGTAWMAFYSLTMLSIALELAPGNRGYEDLAAKFFEHFVSIADAINTFGGTGLWDERDGFYYDRIRTDHHATELRIRSFVGLIALLGVEVLEEEKIRALPRFAREMDWFLAKRTDLKGRNAICELSPDGARRILALPARPHLERALGYVFDEEEFLSPYGIRSLSRYHRDHPFTIRCDGKKLVVDYEPGTSRTDLFGGNSNWRGPVWFPLNYLLVEALERYHHFYGDTLRVAYPTGGRKKVNLKEAANALAGRLTGLFLPDAATGWRPCHGDTLAFVEDPHWRGLVRFNEYFHGDLGAGLGANHQTGWTALVARLMRHRARNRDEACGGKAQRIRATRPRR